MKRTQAFPPLRFEPRLVEEAVFRVIHAGRVDQPLVDRIEKRRDLVYELPSGEDRDSAFQAISIEAFGDLGLDRFLRDVLDEFPLLSALAELRVRAARSQTEEHAELFVRRDDVSTKQIRRGVLWMLVRRFLEEDATRFFLRRECFHLSDMIDERFAYRPDALPRDRSRAWQNLFQDRYRLLWELTIVGRLERQGKAPAGSTEAMRPDFDRVFAGVEADQQEEIFHRVADNDQPTHSLLTEIAGRESAVAGDGQGPVHRGGICPVCRCPTFDWLDAPRAITPDIQGMIRRIRSSWRPEDGICRRCHEVCEAHLV